MAKKMNFTNINDLVERYNAGQSTITIGLALGVSSDVINRVLRDVGVRLRRAGRRRTIAIDMDALVAAYAKGESSRELAKRFGACDNIIRERLRERGIALRGRNDYPPHTREANAAARGRTVPLREKLMRAKTVERLGLHISPHERTLHGLLDKRRVAYVPQKAIGPYNVDVALTEVPIAVEISGGAGAPGRQRIRRKRIEYLLDHGLCVVEVHFGGGVPRVVSPAVGDYVVAYKDFLRRNPTAPREHRMIRSDGKPVATRRNKLNPWPVPPRPVSNLHVS